MRGGNNAACSICSWEDCVAFTNRWERTHPVTVAMVMEHTAGFDDIHFREYAKVDDPDMTLADGLAYNPGARNRPAR